MSYQYRRYAEAQLPLYRRLTYVLAAMLVLSISLVGAFAWSTVHWYGQAQKYAYALSDTGCTTDSDCAARFGGNGDPKPVEAH